MTVNDTVNQHISEYPSLYLEKTYEASKFAVLHHMFIVLGNGIEWAQTKDPKKGGYLTDPKEKRVNGEWVRKTDKPYGKETFALDPRFFTEDVFEVYLPDARMNKGFEDMQGMQEHLHNYFDLNTYQFGRPIFQSELESVLQGAKYGVAYEQPYVADAQYVVERVRGKDTDRNKPYPNFSKEYSCFWEIKPELIQEDWRLEGIAHLKYWLAYFQDPERVKSYHYYPSAKMVKDLKEYAKQKPGESTEDFADRVNKDYEVTCFNGENWQEFANERWAKELQKTLTFLTETIARLEKVS